MNEEFITFKKFNDQNSAKEIGELFAEQNIEFVLVDNSLSFDPTFANNGFGTEYCIKLKKSDFEKANKILADKSENETNEIDEDYYLLSFTDDELIEVITKSDEWNKFDISLAKKLLKDKAKKLHPKKLKKLKGREL